MRWVQLSRPSNKQPKKSSVLRLDLKVAEVLADLVRADSEFQSLGAAAEKACELRYLTQYHRFVSKH